MAQCMTLHYSLCLAPPLMTSKETAQLLLVLGPELQNLARLYN